MEASQSDVRAAFINEDQFPCIECLGLFSPSCTHLFLLFACAASVFFLRVQFRRWIARLIVAELTCTPWVVSQTWQCSASVASG